MHAARPAHLYCNAAFERATGYTAADVLGKTPRILQDPDSCPKARAKLHDALAQWQPVEVELINSARTARSSGSS